MSSNPDQPQFEDADAAFAAAFADDETEIQTEQPTPDGGQPSADEPTGGEAGEQGVDTSENPSQPAPEDEIIASLPEAARAYVEGLRNRVGEFESQHQSLSSELAKTRNDYASMAGKLPHLQRQLAEFEKREKQAQAPAPTPGNVPAPAATGASEDILEAYLQSPKWKEYSNLFPEEAAMWEQGQRIAIKAAEQIARNEAQRAAREITGRFEPVINEITSERAKSAHELAIKDLASEHPDWQQIDSDPRFNEWFDKQWLPSQLDVVQSAFEDERYAKRKLGEPQFVKKLLHEFKDAHGIPRSNAQAATVETPAAPRPASTSARLALAATPSVRSAPPTRVSLERMSVDQAFQAGLNSDD